MRVLHKSTPPLLFVPIETKVRELDGKLLFSLVAAERGYEVVLGSQEKLREQLHRFRPGIYIDKSISVSKEQWFREVHGLRHRIAAWDEEGLVYFDAQTLKAMRLGSDSLQQIDLFFAWGQAQMDDIRSVLPGVVFPVVVTGNPRFDVLRPEYRPFYADAAARLRERHGRILLINTGFPFANHYMDFQALKRAWTKYPVPSGFFESWARVQGEAMASFLDLIPRLHCEFPEHTIVVRPHPSENHETWRTKLKGFPRAIVTGEDAAVLWVFAADLLIHFDCTTGIEAYLLGVPSIAYRNVQTPGYRQRLPNSLSYELQNEEAVLNLTRQIVSGMEPRDVLQKDLARRAVAERHITGLDGALASERIIDALERMKSFAGPWRAGRIRPALNHAAGEFRRWMHAQFHRGEGGYVAQKFPGLERAEIQERIERLSRASGRFRKMDVQPAGPACYRIRSA